MREITFVLAFLFSFSHLLIHAENNIKEESIVLETETGDIHGTLRQPVDKSSHIAAIIISGSARADRDGNQPQTKNNSLKMLAEGLVAQNIATLNFDKRGIGQSQRAGSNESKITLDTYVEDVKDWIRLLKEEKGFEEIIVIGHGEGSLIGMVASIDNPYVSKFISIAGTSKRASEAAREQFSEQSASVKKTVYENILKLEQGEKIANVPQEWNILFRASLQPYLISLYKCNPVEEIAKINIPILIVQGDKDMQANEEDAALLANANVDNTEKIIIENMNYVLKEIDLMGQQNQMQTYLRPDFPLNKSLIPAITRFIFK